MLVWGNPRPRVLVLEGHALSWPEFDPEIPRGRDEARPSSGSGLRLPGFTKNRINELKKEKTLWMPDRARHDDQKAFILRAGCFVTGTYSPPAG
jgi:hypothetical protein